jgi:16S rRNA processing protein RimM
MITEQSLQAVGKFLKPHGVNGEITVLRDFDELDFNDYSCVIVDVDGIFVPFFLNSVRQKGAETDLVSIDGIVNEFQAARLTNKIVYVLALEMPEDENAEEGEDGFYAEDFVGYNVTTDDGRQLGEITGIDDSTENFLFVITPAEGSNILIPVADEFIVDIDAEAKQLEVSLPEGLLDL